MRNDCWTEYEERRLVELCERFDAVTIARIMGRSHNAIRRRCSKLGIPIGRQRPWSDEDVAKLKQYIEAGVSYRVIAKRLGRSESSIAGKVKRMNEDAPQREFKHNKDSSCLMALRMPLNRIAEAV